MYPQNPLTAKGLERKEIAPRVILAKRPDCRGGFSSKGQEYKNLHREFTESHRDKTVA